MTQSSRPGGGNGRPRSSHGPRASARSGTARPGGSHAGSTSRGRPAGRRRPSPAAQAAASPGVPKWMLLLIIAVPAAGILGVVGWSQMRSAPDPVVVDPNQEIAALEGKIKGFQTEYQAVVKLIREEQKDEASSRGRRLGDRLSGWLDDWEAVMGPHRDEHGELPPELDGYEAVPVPVLRIRADLVRITGF